MTAGVAAIPERRERIRRETDQTCTIFCPQHEHLMDMCQEIATAEEGRTHDVKWLIRLGWWFMASAVTILLALSSISATMIFRYSDEMRTRDQTRLVLINDIAALNKLAAVTIQRLDGIDKSVVDLTAQFRASHPLRDGIHDGR